MSSRGDSPRDLIDAMKLMVQLGINSVLSGNGSVRLSEHEFLITPSGLPKNRLSIEDLVKFNSLSNSYSGKHKPSVEVNVHKCIYSSVGSARSVLHAHPLHATLLATKGVSSWWNVELVESTYSVGRALIVEPSDPGSLELARKVCECAKSGFNLIIVPRHGVFSWGDSVWRALESIIALEHLAKYYLLEKLVSCCI